MLNLNSILAKKSENCQVKLDTTGLGPPRNEDLSQAKIYSSIGVSDPLPNNLESRRKSDDPWKGLLKYFDTPGIDIAVDE